MLVTIVPAHAAPPAIRTAAIHWPGIEDHVVHGYMAIPAKARGRQPAVLVLADPAAVGQSTAHALVDALARAGFLACTPRGDETLADLGASMRWLQGNRYATGRIALVALGGVAALRAGEIATMADTPPTALLSFAEQTLPTSPMPTLALPLPAHDAGLPPAAIAFLKEHLR